MDFIAGEILYFNKPLKWTSFDLVNKFRYKLSRKLHVKKIKVGHAGTLDPLATGVMIVCTGKATKRIDEFQYQTKEGGPSLQDTALCRNDVKGRWLSDTIQPNYIHTS